MEQVEPKKKLGNMTVAVRRQKAENAYFLSLKRFTLQEIAERLEINRNTAHKLITKARIVEVVVRTHPPWGFFHPGELSRLDLGRNADKTSFRVALLLHNYGSVTLFHSPSLLENLLSFAY